ncbi:5'/3'-nucleotidase SurE [Siphonobacter sp. BAB-5385]|uniref:5'/3'-nucleotidase SurE n=1 Tax=Siphonobacter sp. BAB-5385 TaxID=1864822 RepID=UPI000B9E2532|nr:5'/3'-nucleotidase SurE [Siphonobacter sp. BAB-5385]OZI09249.1 5'/3'-nucleotidase SurE [Siphonobacter sp. BAB-5385]
MSEKKPIILVTNDDDITAKGISILAQAMQELGEVIVIAPDRPQSGQGHAITINNPVRIRKARFFKDAIVAYETTGTPADCVKMGKHLILKDRKPDLVVSGINHGSNTAISILYSGTMSAAMEAAIEGIPAIGFSLADYHPEADFSHTVEAIQTIARQVLEKGLPKHVALNVNFPAKSEEPLKGIRVCRQADARYLESFQQREDPYGRPYYWLDGDFVNFDEGTDTDEWALLNNYVSVVPCKCDLTAYSTLEDLKSWEF